MEGNVSTRLMKVLTYLSFEVIRKTAKNNAPVFSSENEVLFAAESKSIDWQAEVKVPIKKAPYNGQIVSTTAGRIAFNDELPAEVEFVNKLMGDKELKKLIEAVHKSCGPWLTVKMLDAIKAVGYRYATFFGATISMDDILVSEEKTGMMEKANKEVDSIMKQYRQGYIT